MRVLLSMILVASVMLTNCQGTKYFGETFDPVESIQFDDLIVKLDEAGTVEDAVVTGTVEDVCQVKGCWLTLITEDGNSMRVTFKDYGFFVPKDIHGKTVVIKGDGDITITSVDDLKHYAGDEGKSEEEIEAITEPLEEYVFVAEGVFLAD